MRTGLLRVSRGSVSLWQAAEGGLAQVRRGDLAVPMNVGALEDAIIAMLGAESGTPTEAGSARANSVNGSDASMKLHRIDVIVESAWMPVMHLEARTLRRTMRDIEAHLRLRLANYYDDDAEPVARWTLRLDGLPHHETMLGYGCPSGVIAGVERALATCGASASSLQPALAWARANPSQRAWRRHRGWWFWQESDRTLALQVQAGRVLNLNAALSPMSNRIDAWTWATREAARIEGDAGEEALAGGWDDPQVIESRTRWLPVSRLSEPRATHAAASKGSA